MPEGTVYSLHGPQTDCKFVSNDQEVRTRGIWLNICLGEEDLGSEETTNSAYLKLSKDHK